MHEIPITYTDYNGAKRTDICCFHLTKAEITEWLSMPGNYTLDVALKNTMEKGNERELVSFIRDFIYRSYGEKSLDGRRFIKSEEVKANFMETEAYSILFMDLISDAKKAADFIVGVLPKDLNIDIEKILEESQEEIPPEIKNYLVVNN